MHLWCPAGLFTFCILYFYFIVLLNEIEIEIGEPDEPITDVSEISICSPRELFIILNTQRRRVCMWTRVTYNCPAVVTGSSSLYTALSTRRQTMSHEYRLFSRTLMPNTHRRRRRDETALSRRVGVGGVYMNSQLAHDDCRRIRRCERSRWPWPSLQFCNQCYRSSLIWRNIWRCML